MQDSERRAGHIGAASQPGDETFSEQRFAAPQLSLKSQNRLDLDILRKSPPDRLGFSCAVGNERSHGAEVDGP